MDKKIPSTSDPILVLCFLKGFLSSEFKDLKKAEWSRKTAHKYVCECLEYNKEKFMNV